MEQTLTDKKITCLGCGVFKMELAALTKKVHAFIFLPEWIFVADINSGDRVIEFNLAGRGQNESQILC